MEDTEIDYALREASIDSRYYIGALIIFAIIWLVNEKWTTGILAGYLFLVFAVTVLSRRSGIRRFEFVPFWSYGNPDLYEQIILNIFLFIPVGLFGAKVIGWKIIPVAVCFSLLIEMVQLVTGRGLMEFDDVIHNTLGATIGLGIYMIARKLWKKCRGI